jgi:hypothetical protein
MGDWVAIELANDIKENNILLVADEKFDSAYIISSNDLLKWKKNSKHTVTASVGIDAGLDMDKFFWVKIL